MPPARWYPTSIHQTYTAGGFVIQLYTSDPVHLLMYYSDVPPWVHRRSDVLRGLPAPWQAYWCFQRWFHIEQLEPGDTLQHTFIWRGWTHCQTKWFTFRGKIASQWSVSQTPIFHKHYDEAQPTNPGTIIVFPTDVGTINEIEHQHPNVAQHWAKCDDVVFDGDGSYVYSREAAYHHDTYIHEPANGSGLITAIRIKAYFKDASAWPPGAECDFGFFHDGHYHSPMGGYYVPLPYYTFYEHEWTAHVPGDPPWTWDQIEDLELMVCCRGGFGLETRCTLIYMEIDHL